MNYVVIFMVALFCCVNAQMFESYNCATTQYTINLQGTSLVSIYTAVNTSLESELSLNSSSGGTIQRPYFSLYPGNQYVLASQSTPPEIYQTLTVGQNFSCPETRSNYADEVTRIFNYVRVVETNTTFLYRNAQLDIAARSLSNGNVTASQAIAQTSFGTASTAFSTNQATGFVPNPGALVNNQKTNGFISSTHNYNEFGVYLNEQVMRLFIIFANRVPKCGNSLVETANGETCDDGNTNAGDGCSSTCTIESGWTCAQNMYQEQSVCIRGVNVSLSQSTAPTPSTSRTVLGTPSNSNSPVSSSPAVVASSVVPNSSGASSAPSVSTAGGNVNSASASPSTATGQGSGGQTTAGGGTTGSPANRLLNWCTTLF